MLRKVGSILTALGTVGIIWTEWPFRSVTRPAKGRGRKGLGSGKQKGSLGRTRQGVMRPGEKEEVPGTVEEEAAGPGTGERGQRREWGLAVTLRVFAEGWRGLPYYSRWSAPPRKPSLSQNGVMR